MKITATLCITSECNLRCKYCYEKNKQHGRMSETTYKNIINSFLPFNRELFGEYFIDVPDLTHLELDFFGGEVTLYPELMEEIVDYAFLRIQQFDLPVALTIRVNTNGTIMTPALRHFYAKYKKFITIALTIDGCKEMHDMCRVDANGNGTWNKVVNNLDTYFSFFPSARQTKITLNKDNVHLLYKSYKDLEKMGFKIIQAYPANGLDDWTQEAVNEYNHQLDLIYDDLVSQGTNPKLTYEPFNRGSTSYYSGYNHHATCGVAGYERQITFDTQGNIFNCLRFASHNISNPKYEPFVLGNINNGGVTEKGNERINQLRDYIFETLQKCEGCCCHHAGACEICAATSYEETGRLGAMINNDFECQMSRHLYVKSKEYMYWLSQQQEANNNGN